MKVSISMSTLFTLLVMFTFSTTIYAQTKPSSLSGMVTRYEEWTRRFGRDYKNSVEYEFRFAIYQANVEYIDLINSQNLSFKLSDNQFADMTNEEFILMHMGVNGIEFPNVTQSSRFGHGVDVQLDLPESVDWVEEGAVTDIKRQGKCGSCWAFSAAAALEGLNKIKTEKLESLSVQQLIDCDLHHGNNGCNGGLMDRAFNYVKANGLVSEDDYPYIGRNGKCKDDIISDPVVKITGYKEVPSFNEDALQAAVAQQPVSAAMDGQGLAFQFYSSGIFSPVFCGLRINHGITIVGYGEENGQKYWLLKNSWGTSWGESGYAKILRGNPLNLAGTCGIALKCTYPTM